MASQHPQIGIWYEDRSFDTIFEVVAIDEDAGTIELQYANGDIDEIELDQWDHGAFVTAPPPEDAYGAYGMDEYDEWDDEGALQSQPVERFHLTRLPDVDEF